MNTKRKVAAGKEQWEAMRARYTWYLRPAAKDENEFDRSHWWEKPADTEAIAALYELARRHPLVGELRSWLHTQMRTVVPRGEYFLAFEGMEKFDTPEGRAKWKPNDMSEELRGALRFISDKVKKSAHHVGAYESQLVCLAMIGEASWVKLRPEDICHWRESVGKMRGVEGRAEFQVCRCITADVGSTIEYYRQWKTIRRKTEAWRRGEWVRSDDGSEEAILWPVHKKWYGEVEESDSEEWEECIKEAVMDAHAQGHLLLAVAPDLTLKEAKRLLVREYRQHLNRTAKAQERAKWEDWLPIIAEFENAEASKLRKTSQEFASYKRIIDGVEFPSRAEASVKTKE